MSVPLYYSLEDIKSHIFNQHFAPLYVSSKDIGLDSSIQSFVPLHVILEDYVLGHIKVPVYIKLNLCDQIFYVSLRDIFPHQNFMPSYFSPYVSLKDIEFNPTVTNISTKRPLYKYFCELCEKYFKDKDKLRRHKRKHTEEKPFSCDHCGRKFSQKNNLTVHKRIHTGVKPFKCKVSRCGKMCTQFSHLQDHYKNHHPDDPVPEKSGSFRLLTNQQQTQQRTQSISYQQQMDNQSQHQLPQSRQLPQQLLVQVAYAPPFSETRGPTENDVPKFFIDGTSSAISSTPSEDKNNGDTETPDELTEILQNYRWSHSEETNPISQ